jgi:hypothetical protein
VEESGGEHATRLAVGLEVVDEVLRDPRPREPQLRGRHLVRVRVRIRIRGGVRVRVRVRVRDGARVRARAGTPMRSSR